MPHTIATHTRSDPRYPAQLLQLARPPEQIYWIGPSSVWQLPLVAVVGTRKMSSYGRAMVERFIPVLVQAGIGIVSGLALGIDAHAHTVTTQYRGTCLAIVGNGLDRCYPAAHYSLRETIIAQQGCILSSYPAGMPALPHHFPERNYLIAAFAQVVVIVEAGERSGTLHTAQAALELGKDVCVIPGDITRPGSQGILRLLREGAYPVSDPADILELMQLTPGQGRLQPSLTGEQLHLYDLISHGTDRTELLAAVSGLPLERVHQVLTMLELQGCVTVNSGRWQSIW